MKTILIEGWRGINHSYAMVNQFQLLELSTRDINLFHNDIPSPLWNTVKNSSGFDDKRIKIIKSIPSITSITNEKVEKVDVTYRISYPLRFHSHNYHHPIFCFGTSELQNLDNYNINPSEIPNVKIITPSNWSKLGFIHHGFNPEDIFIVSHGVDTDIYAPVSAFNRITTRSLLKLRDHNFTFLNIGSMTWNKGIDKLISAFTEINLKYPDTRLILKDQSNLYGITASTLTNNHPNIGILSDNLTLSQLNLLYNASDAYIAPYRAEGFNLPPLEAAACGIPIAVTAGGSTDDYTHDSFALNIQGIETSDKNNTYIEPDLDSIISTMDDLINRPSRTSCLNPKEAITYINNNLSWKKVTDRLMEVLNG